VRGAPAIGIAAAYGAYLGIKESDAESREQFTEELRQVSDYLNSSRPSAVNLSWALRRIARRVGEEESASVPELKQVIKAEADQIRREDEEVCRKIGEHALSLLEPGWGLLTHCNAGTVATARYGTALAPIYLGEQQGYDFSVYADETRPLLQGIRLTAWELQQAGVDVTVICDSMASLVMKQQKVQAVVVGCDRVAANGDAANKIGTSGLAILAKHYGIPFYIHAPLSTIDMECASGDDIPIEEREPDEISKRWYAAPMAPEGTPSYNPAFDVTDAELITAIITEKGVVYPPYTENLRRLFE
jgi:methylthioribose-1-phosphate isomerase